MQAGHTSPPPGRRDTAPEPWGWVQVDVRAEFRGWFCGCRVWPSDFSPATFLQTPPHAELLVRGPQGEACVLGARGHPGGPAPGWVPAGEPRLALSCCSNLWPPPWGCHVGWSEPILPHQEPSSPGRRVTCSSTPFSTPPPARPCLTLCVCPHGACYPATGPEDGHLASSSASNRGQGELALVPEAAEQEPWEGAPACHFLWGPQSPELLRLGTPAVSSAGVGLRGHRGL